MSPIPGAATHAENSRSPHEDHTRATSGPLSVVPDPPTRPTPQGPIDFAHELSNNFSPWDPTLEYRLKEYRGLYVNHLDPFLIEYARHAVGSGTHPGSGGLSHGAVSERPCAFSEANPRGHFEDVLVPIVCPPPGQAMPCESSGDIGARVAAHPPAHVPGRGQYGMYCIGEKGEEPALGNGEMNRAE